VKLLVDECLSEELTKLAQERGHREAPHIAWTGKRWSKEGRLKGVILEGNWTLSQRTVSIFRGTTHAPGARGQYADVALHAGLICRLHGPVGMDPDLQLELFEAALDELDRDEDIVNQVLQVTLRDLEDEIDVSRYQLPD
jgi:hypothetical protein